MPARLQRLRWQIDFQEGGCNLSDEEDDAYAPKV